MNLTAEMCRAASPVGTALKGEFEGLQRSELVILVARIRHRRVVYR